MFTFEVDLGNYNINDIELDDISLFEIFAEQHGKGAREVWNKMTRSEKNVFYKPTLERCREMHHGEMLSLSIPYLEALCKLEDETKTPCKEVCFQTYSAQTEWEDAMKDQRISFTTRNEKYLCFAESFFHGLWTGSLNFVHEFAMRIEIFDDNKYRFSCRRVASPWIHGGITTVIERIANCCGSAWTENVTSNEHPHKQIKPQTYTFHDLLNWTKYDIAEFKKKYPEEEYSDDDS